KVKVTITATGCSKTSPPHTVTINCKLGKSSSSLATVFPKHSYDYFVIHTPGLQNAVVGIYDLTGKLLEKDNISSEITEVARDLPAGVYFAKIEVNGEPEQVLKLMKNE